ncbi:hypothetical protein Tco_0566713 [Tanacetum coccineum]
MPRMVANVFEERIHDLLYETLKNILPELIKDSVKQSLQKFDKRMKKTLKATVPNLILKLLNKEFNALNTLESRSCLDNAKHQMQLIQYLEQLVHSQVRVLRDIMVINAKQLQTKVEKNAADISKLVELTTEIVRLMDLAPSFNMMAAKGEKDTAREGPLTIKEAKAQMEEIKRLAELKAEKEKTEKRLKKLMTLDELRAHVEGTAIYEEKRARMEQEFHLATTPVLTRNDIVDARKIDLDNLDNLGLGECKASTSNLRRIQVKDIIKNVKDYLKTCSLAGMDISW